MYHLNIEVHSVSEAICRHRKIAAMRQCKTSTAARATSAAPLAKRINMVESYTVTDHYAVEGRHSLIVVSWNMLAHCWSGAASEASQQKKYPHCDLKYLAWEHRLPLIKRDLVSFDADIICLQEVDYSKYHLDLQPFMFRHGYASYIQSCKNEEKQRYGVATFFRSHRFEFVAEASRSRGMVTIVREPAMKRMYGIANCHLQAYPSSEKVRYTQLKSLILVFEKFDLTHSFVTGDFNCEEGEMCLTWATMHHTGVPNPVADATTHRSILRSAFLGDKTPSYIGPAPWYNGMRLDHVLISQTLKLKAGIHPYGHRAEEITTRGLPNRLCPSDHLPVGGLFDVDDCHLWRTNQPFFITEAPMRPTRVAPAEDVINRWAELLRSAPQTLSRGKPTEAELLQLQQHAAAKKSLLMSLLPEEQTYLKHLAKQMRKGSTVEFLR